MIPGLGLQFPPRHVIKNPYSAAYHHGSPLHHVHQGYLPQTHPCHTGHIIPPYRGQQPDGNLQNKQNTKIRPHSKDTRLNGATMPEERPVPPHIRPPTPDTARTANNGEACSTSANPNHHSNVKLIVDLPPLSGDKLHSGAVPVLSGVLQDGKHCTQTLDKGQLGSEAPHGDAPSGIDLNLSGMRPGASEYGCNTIAANPTRTIPSK
jgi:hypothetical protein